MEYLEESEDGIVDARTGWNFHQPRCTRTSEESLQRELQAISPTCYLSSPTSTDDLEGFLEEVVVLLNEHFIGVDEDVLRSFQTQHLHWLLMPDSSKLQLLIAIRDSNSHNEIIGFIAAYPALLHVNNEIPDWLQDMRHCEDEDGRSWDGSDLCMDSEAQASPKEQNMVNREVGLVDFICVRKDKRGQGLCPLLLRVVAHRLASLGLHGMVQLSAARLTHPATTAQHFHLLLNIPKLEDVGFCQPSTSSWYAEGIRDVEPDIVASFKPLAARHLTSALHLLNEQAKQSALGLLFRDEEHIRHIFLKFPELVVTLVKEDGLDRSIVTDFVSFKLAPSRLLCADNAVLRLAQLYYSVANTVSVCDLIKVAAIHAADEHHVDSLGILPMGIVHEADCSNVRAERGDGALQVYLHEQVGIRRQLQSQEIFVFPGI